MIKYWYCKTCNRRKEDIWENGCDKCRTCPLVPVEETLLDKIKRWLGIRYE